MASSDVFQSHQVISKGLQAPCFRPRSCWASKGREEGLYYGLFIEDITYRIRNQGGDIDLAMAKFVVQAYAARNQVCHGESAFGKRGAFW